MNFSPQWEEDKMATKFETISFMTGVVSELNKRRDRLTAIEDKKAKKAQSDKLFDLKVKEQGLKIDQLETAGEVDDLFIERLKSDLSDQKKATQAQSKVDDNLISNTKRKTVGEIKSLGQVIKQAVAEAKRSNVSGTHRVGGTTFKFGGEEKKASLSNRFEEGSRQFVAGDITARQFKDQFPTKTKEIKQVQVGQLNPKTGRVFGQIENILKKSDDPEGDLNELLNELVERSEEAGGKNIQIDRIFNMLGVTKEEVLQNKKPEPNFLQKLGGALKETFL